MHFILLFSSLIALPIHALNGTITKTSYSISNPNIITNLSINDGNGNTINLQIPDGNNILDQGTISTADGYTISTNDKGVLTVSKSGLESIVINPPAGLILSTTALTSDGFQAATITDGKGNIVTLTSNGTNPYTITSVKTILGTDSGGHDIISNGIAGQMIVHNPSNIANKITVTLPPQPSVLSKMIQHTLYSNRARYYGKIPGTNNLLSVLPDGTKVVMCNSEDYPYEYRITVPVTLENNQLIAKPLHIWSPAQENHKNSFITYSNVDPLCIKSKHIDTKIVSFEKDARQNYKLDYSTSTTGPDGKTKPGYSYISVKNGGGIPMPIDDILAKNILADTNYLNTCPIAPGSMKIKHRIKIGNIGKVNNQDTELYVDVRTDINSKQYLYFYDITALEKVGNTKVISIPRKQVVDKNEDILYNIFYDQKTGTISYISLLSGKIIASFVLSPEHKTQLDRYDTTKPVTYQLLYYINVMIKDDIFCIVKCNIPLSNGTTEIQYRLKSMTTNHDKMDTIINPSTLDAVQIPDSKTKIYNNPNTLSAKRYQNHTYMSSKYQESKLFNLRNPVYEIPQELLDEICSVGTTI